MHIEKINFIYIIKEDERETEREKEEKKHNFSTSLLFRKFVTRNKKFSNNSYAYMPRGMEQGYNIVKCNMRSLRVKRYQSHFLFDILPLYFNERNHFCCEFYHPRASYIAIFYSSQFILLQHMCITCEK